MTSRPSLLNSLSETPTEIGADIRAMGLFSEILDVCRRSFRVATPISFCRKDDGTISSVFERELEERIGEILRGRTPWANVIGEEGLRLSSDDPSSEFAWLIDPIDGTISFRNGLDTFSVVATLTRRDVPIATFIYFPSLERRYEAFVGQGVLLNGEPLVPRAPVGDSSAVFAVSDEETFDLVRRRFLIDELRVAGKRLRHYTDLYGHALVTHGSCILKVDAACARWDRMPAQLLAQEGGLQSEFFPVENPSDDLEGTLIVYHDEVAPLVTRIRELIRTEGACAAD